MTQRTFSGFIRNASDEEKGVVFANVLEGIQRRQAAVLHPPGTGRWPDYWRARARQLLASGVPIPRVATTITEESGRYCSRQQAKSMQRSRATTGENKPWPDEWPARAAELHHEGVSASSIAEIITIEAHRPLSLNITLYWLRKAGLKPPKRARKPKGASK